MADLPAPLPPPARWRPLAALVVLVTAAHLVLLQPPQRPPAPPRPVPSLQVRQIVLAPPAPAPAPGPPAEPEPGPPAEPTAAAPALPPPPLPPPPLPPTPPLSPTPLSRAEPPPSPAPAVPPGAMPAEPALAAGPDPDAEPGDTGVEPPPAGAPLPRPPTRLPEAAVLHYRVQRGPQAGVARMVWGPDGDRYAMVVDAHLGGRPWLQQHSRGSLDSHGLAPALFSDRRRGRGAQQAQFDADGGRIVFSGPAAPLPAWPGAQDRLGWIVQLAGIVAAAPEPPPQVLLYVVGARGGAGTWRFEWRGRSEVHTPLGRVEALVYERAPAVLRDMRVQVWLDPSRAHWPVMLRYTPVLGGPPLEWVLAAEPKPP